MIQIRSSGVVLIHFDHVRSQTEIVDLRPFVDVFFEQRKVQPRGCRRVVHVEGLCLPLIPGYTDITRRSEF